MKNSTSTPTPVYLPSGRFGFRAVAVLLLGGVASALLIGQLYLWARSEVASFVAILLCDLFFMTVNIIVLWFLLRATHSRSSRLNRLAAGTWALLVLAPYWVQLALPYLLSSMHAADSFQSYSMAMFAAAILLLEAAILMLPSLLIAGGIAAHPYSEDARKWAEREFSGEWAWPAGNAEGLMKLLGELGTAALLQLRPATGKSQDGTSSSWRTIKAIGQWVEPDPDARWISLDIIEHERNGDGRVKSTATPLLTSWHVGDGQYRAIRDHLQNPPPIAEEAVAPRVDHGNAPPPPELEPAVEALDAGDFRTTLTVAMPHCRHPSQVVQADANRLCALALSRLGLWDEAFSHYHELFGLEPSEFSALQLATTSVMGGELHRGQAWFERAERINQESRQMQPAKLRTAFLSALSQAGQHEACLPHLEWLAGLYASLDTTDSHILWMYGIPQFGEFLHRSHASLRKSMSEAELRHWYLRLADGLPQEWRTQLEGHLLQISAET